MNKLITRIVVTTMVLCIWAGPAVANCEVTLYEHAPPGGKQIVIRQSDFPNGFGQTFMAAPNQWERAMSIINKTISGDFDYNTSDLIWIAGIAEPRENSAESCRRAHRR